MLSVHIETLTNWRSLSAKAELSGAGPAFKLREAANSERDARIIVRDLSEVRAIEGGGIGMLVFLQRWAHDHNIRLKLFNPANLCGTGWTAQEGRSPCKIC